MLTFLKGFKRFGVKKKYIAEIDNFEMTLCDL